MLSAALVAPRLRRLSLRDGHERLRSIARAVRALLASDEPELWSPRYVQFFVKAYRRGDPGLGGIYPNRLVQVPTGSSWQPDVLG